MVEKSKAVIYLTDSLDKENRPQERVFFNKKIVAKTNIYSRLNSNNTKMSKKYKEIVTKFLAHEEVSGITFDKHFMIVHFVSDLKDQAKTAQSFVRIAYEHIGQWVEYTEPPLINDSQEAERPEIEVVKKVAHHSFEIYLNESFLPSEECDVCDGRYEGIFGIEKDDFEEQIDTIPFTNTASIVFQKIIELTQKLFLIELVHTIAFTEKTICVLFYLNEEGLEKVVREMQKVTEKVMDEHLDGIKAISEITYERGQEILLEAITEKENEWADVIE